MTTPAEHADPLDPLVDPARAEELAENRTMITDLARATGDPELQLHLTAIRYCDELLFVHEALMETHQALGSTKAADDEASLVFMAKQLALHHLNVIDCSLFRGKP
jgi:hypothetical protein